MTDHHTDALFDMDARDAVAVKYDVSRLVVDPERFTDDAAEKMSARGMGVIYTRTSHGKPLRQAPRPDQRSKLLDRYYHPHHERLTEAVGRSLARHKRCLVLDCHSFPARPLPYEFDQTAKRLDICLGTDAFHTPPKLLDRAKEAFRAEGFTVSVNRPFSGALVPSRWYGKDARVEALMVEVNRGRYMNEKTGKRLADFSRTSGRVMRALKSVTDWWR